MIESLGKGDQLVEMEVSSEARRKHPHLPRHFDVRAIRYQRKGYSPRTLLTSLVDAKLYPAEELRALYHERWERPTSASSRPTCSSVSRRSGARALTL
jgi:hypothetical protein